jgi:hypothetical protein
MNSDWRVNHRSMPLKFNSDHGNSTTTIYVNVEGSNNGLAVVRIFGAFYSLFLLRKNFCCWSTTTMGDLFIVIVLY